MTLTTTDEPLLRHSDPTLARRLPSAIHEARAELPAIVADILAIPESALVRPWPWIGGGEEEVRYGIYRLHELFERAGIEAVRAIRAAGRDGGAAADIVAPATAARWDLHGLLASLSDADIDADPGGGEWTIRRTLGHAINAQRAYAWSTACGRSAGSGSTILTCRRASAMPWGSHCRTRRPPSRRARSTTSGRAWTRSSTWPANDWQASLTIGWATAPAGPALPCQSRSGSPAGRATSASTRSSWRRLS